MNYIKKLEAENKQLKGALSDIEKALRGIEIYLAMEKFHWPDDYIRIHEVLGQLEPIATVLRDSYDLLEDYKETDDVQTNGEVDSYGMA